MSVSASPSFRSACARAPARRGVTLIELCVVLAIVALLVTLGYPDYREQVRQAQLGSVVGALGDARAAMEQHYLNQGSYEAGPCRSATRVDNFTLQCLEAPTAAAYLISATGSGAAAGFVYSIDQRGSQRSLGLPASWGSVPPGGLPCLILHRGDTC
ncbi:MAG: hypothetical protein RJA44_428 [Pseudomonadota bacterium]|jgi:type IV pilus assembly protein PilE